MTKKISPEDWDKMASKLRKLSDKTPPFLPIGIREETPRITIKTEIEFCLDLFRRKDRSEALFQKMQEFT